MDFEPNETQALIQKEARSFAERVIRPVAAELDRLYSYISGRLLDVTVKRDATAIDETYKLMSTLREAWAQAATSGVIATAAPPPAEVALRP